MYRNIELQNICSKVVVLQFSRGVGATEYVNAIRLAYPDTLVVDNGMTASDFSIEDDCTCIAVVEKTQELDKVRELSKNNENKPIEIFQANNAYSDEYEQKHKNRGAAIEAGFDYNGLNYQIDDKSRTNIAGKALSLVIDSTINSVDWVSNTQDADGKDIVNTFTRDEFIEFAKQSAIYYESIILNR